MPVIHDDEFGSITVRKSARSASMRATVAPNGSLRISVPSYAPIFMVKRMIASSRSDLRKLLSTKPKLVLSDGMTIGKSHSLHVRTGTHRSVKRTGNQLVVTLGPTDSLESDSIVSLVHAEILSALRREAKHHLPRRIEYLAERHGFGFTSLRFTHASTRWGSCNSKKAISLNIALMNIPFELIDYVLIHELSHTVHLDHSTAFWATVEAIDPEYKHHRKLLKAYNPSI